jgi:hypothetical protein
MKTPTSSNVCTDACRDVNATHVHATEVIQVVTADFTAGHGCGAACGLGVRIHAVCMVERRCRQLLTDVMDDVVPDGPAIVSTIDNDTCIGILSAEIIGITQDFKAFNGDIVRLDGECVVETVRIDTGFSRIAGVDARRRRRESTTGSNGDI